MEVSIQSDYGKTLPPACRIEEDGLAEVKSNSRYLRRTLITYRAFDRNDRGHHLHDRYWRLQRFEHRA